MKSHIRIDGFKLFEKDKRRLELIMKNEDLNKSESYRFALEFYERFHEAANELRSIKSSVLEQGEMLKDVYFKLDILGDKS